MPTAPRQAIPLVPLKLGIVGARHDGICTQLATGVTVLTAAVAVFLVAAATVAFAIN